ncbi:hypothetical protein ABIA30_004740 [Mycobacterium sp. MAA66]|uniref:hypothetical protein n=1 Tax=Mycobacterium sp. MAA66 TaxID=3156297 RepID=UPI00351196FF
MDDEALRNVSKGLFGNRHKLEVIAAIGDAIVDGAQDVYPRMISKTLRDAADKQVGEIFTQLRCGGLLIPVADKTDLQKHRYRARESEVWEVARNLLAELQAAAWRPDELTGY